jgi:orotate phosphoribosyltransferase
MKKSYQEIKDATEFAEILLRTEAVKLDLENLIFWTSGIKSPIYCDNRLLLSFLKERIFVEECLSRFVYNRFANSADIIAGVATAGIPWGYATASDVILPYCYVRPEPKKHGMKNQIEGYMPKGSKVVLVEDLISTGKSSLLAIDAVLEAGSEVIGVIALFTYGFKESKEGFKNANVPFYTISDFETLCNVARQKSYLPIEQIGILKSFAKDPHNWASNLKSF